MAKLPTEHAAPDPSSYTLERIRSMLGSLSASEQRVAQLILDHPNQFLEWSAAEIAKHSSTSDATAVRTCGRLGFGGLRDLRLTLARDLGWPTSHERKENVQDRSLIQELFDDAARSMSTMVSKKGLSGFRRAATLLSSAEKILAVANGPSAVFAEDFAITSRLHGQHTEFWGDTIMQTVIANQLGRHDVLVAVSASGVNALTIEVAEAARKAGSKVIAVTGYGQSRLVEIANVAVVAETLDYSTISQAAINSAALLLMLRGLVIAGVANAGTESESARIGGTGLFPDAAHRFAYRRPTTVPSTGPKNTTKSTKPRQNGVTSS